MDDRKCRASLASFSGMISLRTQCGDFDQECAADRTSTLRSCYRYSLAVSVHRARRMLNLRLAAKYISEK